MRICLISPACVRVAQNTFVRVCDCVQVSVSVCLGVLEVAGFSVPVCFPLEDPSHVSDPFSLFHLFLVTTHPISSFSSHLTPIKWIRDPGRAAPRAWWH